MRILITNDDGIRAEGLDVMTQIAHEIAGDAGEVWTVAPELEQSGVAHAISYINPMRIRQDGARRFAVEGMPADCVLAALSEVMDTAPDLILSGVNRGNNAGQNTLYSGTVGAAIEGTLQGVKSIALSQYYGPLNKDLDDTFEAARMHGADTIRKILDADVWGQAPYSVFYNVNFPAMPAADCKGIALAPQGFRENANFYANAQTSPNGREFLWIGAGSQQEPTTPGTDVQVALEGYIAVTPMHCDLTNHAALEKLNGIFS
ncbi:MAG: 5'/3'-nucleotidase SurE [Rhodobacteraceae bacterium]|nr:MAG: 5'/3'-nucleotidase SurE [Paracoccaceae bacterium]